jgi:hypothetical protein
MLDLSAVGNKPLINIHKRQLYIAITEAISFIEIIDLKNGETLLEIKCTSAVSNRKDTDIFTDEEQNRIYLHKSSKCID